MSEQVNMNNVNVARIVAETFGHSNIFATYLLTYLLTNTPIINNRHGVATWRVGAPWRFMARRSPSMGLGRAFFVHVIFNSIITS